MDPETTVKSRCEAIGLADGGGARPTATVRAGAPRVGSATVRSPVSGPATSRSSRELPKISVELRGTLSGPERDAPPASGETRDLEVLRTLGEGGMGRVFLARQHSLDRDVAIKTVRHSGADPERVALLAEGAITGHLEHPGVIPVHALGVDEDGRPVLVMKRVEGAPWSDLLEDPSHPTWRDLGGDAADRLDGHLQILMQVCNAVEFAHSRGILHRDIKPQNVLIGRYGEIYLADWGLALRLLDGEAPPQPLCGTPSYMAPEMVLGDPVDARTDVYLLGATLHQVLTGAPRHRGESVQATLVAAMESLPFDYPPSVPEALGALANRATSVTRANRPASAAELRQGLADYLRHKSSVALGRSARERLDKVRTLLGNPEGPRSEAWQREMDVLAAEAGFALEEALREWRDNPDARRGTAELEELLATRRSRAAELERLARELDPGVSHGQRKAALGAVAFVGVGLSVSAFLADGRGITTASLLLQSLGPLAVVTGVALVLRRSLLRTVLNRRVTLGLVVLTGAITADRGLGLLAGVSPAHVLLYDCLVAAALGAVGAVYLARRVALPAAVMLGAAVCVALAPDRAMAVFSAATGLALLVVVAFAWKNDGRL